MRLLVDCAPLRAGGGIQVAIAFIEGLCRCTDVDWLAVLPDSMRLAQSDWDKSRIALLSKTSLLDLARARFMLSRMERDFAPDVVFTVFGPAYFRPKVPHVVGFALPNLIYEPTGHLADAAGPGRWLSDAVKCTLLRKADHLVVETETVRERLARRIGFDRGRISVIGNCVNPLLMRHSPGPPPRSGRFAILVPSAYYLHKNLEIVPPVAAALLRLQPGFDFEFRLTLDPLGGPWLALKRAAARLGVADRVVTLGYLPLDDLAAAYQSASAVFLPTLREASTAVYPESFYFRRPLVTSDMDFARELCGDAALFVPPLEPETIAGKLLDLNQTDGLARTLVANGERRLKSGYPTAETKFNKQLDLLATVSGDERRAIGLGSRTETSRRSV